MVLFRQFENNLFPTLGGYAQSHAQPRNNFLPNNSGENTEIQAESKFILKLINTGTQLTKISGMQQKQCYEESLSPSAPSAKS